MPVGFTTHAHLFRYIQFSDYHIRSFQDTTKHSASGQSLFHSLNAALSDFTFNPSVLRLLPRTEKNKNDWVDTLTRAPLGYSAERAPLGGGAYSAPCLTPELIGAARRARRRSKALNEKIPMRIKKILKRSHVRSRSGQRSETCVFGLLPIETGLSTVECPNSPKTLLCSRRAV